MKKILKNNKKTKAYLDSLPTMYIVGRWDKYGVEGYPFTGKYETDERGYSIPLVYKYNDTCDNWYLCRLDYITAFGGIWTQHYGLAMTIAEMFNEEIGK